MRRELSDGAWRAIMTSDTFDDRYFRDTYDRGYDLHNPPRKAAFYLSQIVAVQAGGRLLDVGCAFGSFLSVARQRFEVAGVDVSPHAVEVARSRLPGVDIGYASAGEICGDRQFDVVTCFDTLEHITHLEEALMALRGALAPAGVLAVTVPVFDGVVGRVVRFLDHDPTHVWKRGRSFWEEKLESQGLCIVRRVGLWRYLFPWRMYLFFGARLLYRLSPAVMLIGRPR